MATLFDNSVIAYQTIAVPLSASRPNPYFLFVYCEDVPLTNIQLWGIVRFYRLRSVAIGVIPTVFESYELRAIGHRFGPLETALVGASDGFQFVPTFDFDRVLITDNQP